MERCRPPRHISLKTASAPDHAGAVSLWLPQPFSKLSSELNFSSRVSELNSRRFLEHHGRHVSIGERDAGYRLCGCDVNLRTPVPQKQPENRLVFPAAQALPSQHTDAPGTKH